jgi:serine protease
MSLDSRHRKSWRHLLLLAVVVASIGIVGTVKRVRAQAEQWTPAYPLILTPERALAFVQAAEQKLDYLPGEVIVKFKPGVTAASQQRALMALRSRPALSDMSWLTEDTALHRDKGEWDATILAAQLSEQPEVAYAQPNYLRHSNAIPNNPGFARQWNLTAIDLPSAWDINPGASNAITVAVIDSGMTMTNQTYTFPTWNGLAIQNVNVPFHTDPGLSSSRIVNAADFVFWTGPVLDMAGHGSHVAGTIGEDTNNDFAEAGIAYKANIMPVKVCLGYWEVQFILSSNNYAGFVPPNVGGCRDSDIAQGIRYAADNGAKVINISLGGQQPTQITQDALTYAVGKGAFIAISAGNCGRPDLTDECPSQIPNQPSFPAAYASNIDGVMAVGAVGPTLTRAYYSNANSSVEIAAPGGDDRYGPSGEIWQVTLYPPDSVPASVIGPRFDRYNEEAYEGTSMAAPHVAGVAALIMSQGVTNPAMVEALIKKTARPLGSGGRNNEYGYGLIQPRAALFGFGIAK